MARVVRRCGFSQTEAADVMPRRRFTRTSFRAAVPIEEFWRVGIRVGDRLGRRPEVMTRPA